MPRPKNSLTLPESMMLLALDDDNGHVVTSSSTALPYAIAGAILFELCERGCLTIADKKVTQWPSEPVGDPVLDLAILRLAKRTRIQTVKYWVQQISRDHRKITDLILQKLIRLGTIRRDERKLLWIIPYERFPTQDASLETGLRKRLHEWVLGTRPINAEGYCLLSLVGVSNLQKEVFEKRHLAEAKRYIKRILKEEEIGAAVSEVVQCVQAAVMASIVASTVAASVASS